MTLELQTASQVTYEPNKDVQNVIAKDPNIVDVSKRVVSAEARRDMEQHLALFKEANPEFILDDTTGDINNAKIEVYDEQNMSLKTVTYSNTSG